MQHEHEHEHGSRSAVLSYISAVHAINEVSARQSVAFLSICSQMLGPSPSLGQRRTAGHEGIVCQGCTERLWMALGCILLVLRWPLQLVVWHLCWRRRRRRHGVPTAKSDMTAQRERSKQAVACMLWDILSFPWLLTCAAGFTKCTSQQCSRNTIPYQEQWLTHKSCCVGLPA